MNTPVNTPSEIFSDQLRDLHSMEEQLCEAMPSLISLRTNNEVRDLVVSHAHQSEN